MTPRGPDFLCVGQMKAGTGWLYDQLDSHPEFRMPPVKELRYFTVRLHSPALATLSAKAAADLAAVNRKRRRRGQRPLEERDFDFFRRALALQEGAREMREEAAAALAARESLEELDWRAFTRDDLGDIEGYAALFPEPIAGDITPGYSMLSDALVSAIARRFPELKIVLMVRDPVARACSELAMLVRHGRVPADRLEDLDAVARWLEQLEMGERSKASVIWRRWSEAFPHCRFFFFDDLCQRPQWLRREIAEFLGASGEGFQQTADINRSAAGAPPPTDLVRIAAEKLVGELDACAEVFGGPAADWRDRYRNLS
jgi:hypothetical protein